MVWVSLQTETIAAALYLKVHFQIKPLTGKQMSSVLLSRTKQINIVSFEACAFHVVQKTNQKCFDDL